MVYYINNYSICTDTQELRHKEDIQKIEPLIFKLLIFMLNNPDRVLTREELILKVWGDTRVISDSALSATISVARKSIGDSGHKQSCIKTVSTIGYRFIANFTSTNETQDSKQPPKIQQQPPLTNKRHPTESADNSNVCEATTPKPDPTLPDKPSIAIMDFVNQGTNQGGELLATGFTSEVNSAFSRMPHLFVIARVSSASLSNQGLSAKEIGIRLGVRYLVFATIQYISKCIQITVSLIDANQNIEIWSEHYNRSIDDIFLVKNDITSSITTVISTAIEQAEIERAFLIPTENLTAWENYHRGFFYFNKTTSEGVSTAQHYFKQALSHDANFSRANAGLAYTYTSRKLLNDNSSHEEDDLNKAFEFAHKSIQNCNRESMGYMSLGRILNFQHQHESSQSVLKIGLQLNPNYVPCIYFKAISATVLNQNTLAQLSFELANKLSPFDSLQFSIKMVHAVSLAQEKKYTEAAEMALRAIQYPNAYFTTYAIATACLQLAGHSDQARQHAIKLLTLKPDYSVELFNSLAQDGNKVTRACFMQALQESGIPKTSHNRN